MSDEKGSFVPIGDSEERMFGPTGIVLCGFTGEGQLALAEQWAKSGLPEIPVRSASEGDLIRTCLEVAAAAHELGSDSALPRAVLVSGLMEAELIQVMRAYKETGAPRALWAALNENTQSWPLGALLRELDEERKAIEKMASGARKTE